MKLFTFIFLNFCVSCIADIVLNDLASDKSPIQSSILQSLRPYFSSKTIIYSAILAGITIITVLIINILLSILIFRFSNPISFKQLFKFLIIGFPLAYLADIVIDKLKLFGNSLNNYYKIAGAGFWGATAYLFSVLISFILQKYLITIL